VPDVADDAQHSAASIAVDPQVLAHRVAEIALWQRMLWQQRVPMGREPPAADRDIVPSHSQFLAPWAIFLPTPDFARSLPMNRAARWPFPAATACSVCAP